MPDPVSTGTKSPAGVPPAGTGAAAGQTPATTAGSPPDEDLKFEDDQVIEQDGKKMVLLEALLGEREKWKKRVASAAPPPSPAEPAEAESPLFNWEKLVPHAGGQQAPHSQYTQSKLQVLTGTRSIPSDRPSLLEWTGPNGWEYIMV